MKHDEFGDRMTLGDRWKYGTYVKSVLSGETQRSKVNAVEIGYYGNLSLEDRVKLVSEKVWVDD